MIMYFVTKEWIKCFCSDGVKFLKACFNLRSLYRFNLFYLFEQRKHWVLKLFCVFPNIERWESVYVQTDPNLNNKTFKNQWLYLPGQICSCHPDGSKRDFYRQYYKDIFIIIRDKTEFHSYIPAFPKMFLLTSLEFFFQQHLSQQPFPVQTFFLYTYICVKEKKNFRSEKS